eukprot:31233-Pelagococcus_subviridis.AAC.1
MFRRREVIASQPLRRALEDDAQRRDALAARVVLVLHVHPEVVVHEALLIHPRHGERAVGDETRRARRPRRRAEHRSRLRVVADALAADAEAPPRRFRAVPARVEPGREERGLDEP